MIRKCLMSIFLASLTLLAPAVQTNRDRDILTLSVCEALTHAHAQDYDGKMVRIRGQVVATDEGAAFFGEACPGIYRTDGKVWPSAIAWTSPTRSEFILHPINFAFDRASLKRLEPKWKELRKRSPDRCIAVTYAGLFESWSRDKAKKVDSKGRHYEILGFGHLNAAPAQLVLKSADDATPIPNCKEKK